jgi:hypothetical protein
MHVRIARQLLERPFEPLPSPLQLAGLRFHHAALEQELGPARKGLESLPIGPAGILEPPPPHRRARLVQQHAKLLLGSGHRRHLPML